MVKGVLARNLASRFAIVSTSMMAERCGGARKKQHVRKKVDDDKDDVEVARSTKTVTRKRLAFSCIGNKGIVDYGACSLAFPLNRPPGIFVVYMVLLKRLHELFVHLIAHGRFRFKFTIMMKLISVKDPEVTQNCFDGLALLLAKMNEKAEALGGIVISRHDDNKSILRVNLTTATFDALMIYLGTCRKICDECNTWLSVFWVVRDLISYYENYDDIPPLSTGSIVTACFNKTYSILSNLLEDELKQYEFIVDGVTYQCGLLLFY